MAPHHLFIRFQQYGEGLSDDRKLIIEGALRDFIERFRESIVEECSGKDITDVAKVAWCLNIIESAESAFQALSKTEDSALKEEEADKMLAAKFNVEAF